MTGTFNTPGAVYMLVNIHVCVRVPKDFSKKKLILITNENLHMKFDLF